MGKKETLRSLSLSVKDRMMMPGLYPRQSNLMEQVMVKDISEKVSLNQEELKRIEFKPRPNGCTWNEKKARDKKVLFTEAEITFLKDQIDRLDKAKQITQDMTAVCLKIKEK